MAGERRSGKILGVVLWESEEMAFRLRGGAAEATGATVAGVDRYEVTIFEVSS